MTCGFITGALKPKLRFLPGLLSSGWSAVHRDMFLTRMYMIGGIRRVYFPDFQRVILQIFRKVLSPGQITITYGTF